jgi:hypothetical protein
MRQITLGIPVETLAQLAGISVRRLGPYLAGQEALRLVKLSRSSSPEMLDEALNGRDKSAVTLTRLMGFLTQNVGQDSPVTETFWKVIKPELQELGVSNTDLKKIRYPYLRPGERGFKSILDEMSEGNEL